MVVKKERKQRKSAMEKGQILELTIEDMSQEGKGIGKADGFAVFVDGAVVGDRVQVQLQKMKKRYGFGKLLKILEESPDRIESFCEQRGECAPPPGQVIGIESIKGAVLDANRNATINGIVNARYVCGKAEEELPKMMVQADVAILDPPRAGCDERLLEAVVKAKPEKIVYVSCGPATLARDIKWLTENGYEFREATPCDMFPWTSHVETVALISK